MGSKNRFLAAILNIIPGLGYLYLGKRKIFSYILLCSIIIGIIDGYTNPEIIQSTPLNIIGTVLVILAFVYDAYNESGK